MIFCFHNIIIFLKRMAIHQLVRIKSGRWKLLVRLYFSLVFCGRIMLGNGTPSSLSLSVGNVYSRNVASQYPVFTQYLFMRCSWASPSPNRLLIFSWVSESVWIYLNELGRFLGPRLTTSKKLFHKGRC